MKVYTFWEPREKMPYYIQLCMETWKKNLPNAEIVLLDYKNIGEYVDTNEFGEILFSGRFKLALIADAIRIALLAKHGGVWLDADTIILRPEAEKYFLPDENGRTVFFVYPSDGFCQMCFINTPPNSKCMSSWLESVQKKIYNLKPDTPVRWDFFGNSFIDTYVKNHPEEFTLINRKVAMPDKDSISDSKVGAHPAYDDYFFLKNYHLKDVSNDMLFLQNSWTPRFYKVIPPEILLRRDCTMTNVLAEALDIKLPPPQSVCGSKSRTENGWQFPTTRYRKPNERRNSKRLPKFKRKAFSFEERSVCKG